MTETRTISVLGATGSVGAATLDLIERAQPGAYDVIALTAHTNVDELVRLALKFRPTMVALADRAGESRLRAALDGKGIEIGCGADAVVEAARLEADWTMAAIVGAAGLRPTLAALEQGRALAFANKECLVCAGGLFMQAAAAAGTELLPVDSEHNAIFQVFDSRQKKQIEKITLTASGGPFRTWTQDQMRAARRSDALAHPTWDMGAKITIDSATMMNKGLEIIEACWLFDLPESQVDVAVHPQSIVHGLVHYADGSVLSQMGSPDMRTPIANALSWPQRMQAPVAPLDLCAISRLDFETPDLQRFPAMRLAREAVQQGGILPAVLNAANEIAVEAFLAERIGFLEIADTVETVMGMSLKDTDMPQQLSSFDDVFAIDHRARELARELIAVAAA